MAIGILLVGGFGTRLKPLTNQTPKPMLPVGGKPVTEHQLLAAKKAGINTVVLATSYLSEVFTPYFGDGSKWGMNLLYAVESEPLGTGGAIRNAAALVNFADSNEEFVIFNGDVISGHDIAAQLEFHRANSADATLHLIRPECLITLAWVPLYLSGLSAMLLWPGCQFIHSAWVPLYFIRPGCHITLAWVPIYSFGLGAVVFIRPECHIIDLAWVPIYSQSLAKSAIHSRQVCHFIQGWASLPICNLSGLGATFIPHG